MSLRVLFAVTDSVIEAPRFTGLIAYQPNSLIHAERVVVRNVQVDNNDVGIHVQHGSTLATAASAPAAPTDQVVLVTDDSQFVDNVTRIGAAEVPLPTNPFGD